MFGIGKAWGTSQEMFHKAGFCLFVLGEERCKTAITTKIGFSSLMTQALMSSDTVGGRGGFEEILVK